MNILIIDDEKSIRISFEAFLREAGHEVITAQDYDSALKILDHTSPDLIFSDIILGGHTGIDVLREAKNQGHSCPIIMITGEPNVETAAESLRLGAFDYLPKPIRKDTLLRITHVALQNKILTDERDRITEENEKNRCNLETIFKSVSDAIITVDPDMRLVETNKAVNTICGLPSPVIAGTNFAGLTSKCNGDCAKVLADTLHKKKPVKGFTVECCRKDRPGQIVTMTCSPLIDRNDKFKGAVLVIRDMTRLSNLEEELRERYQFQSIIGKSSRMQQIYQLLKYLADTDTTVLVGGESGTGKELVAQALHYSGIRAAGPMVNVNCSALSENLLESELFGHVKGAFTGAIKDKIGRFQMADGGTILLDEIGDISPAIQLKLLRILQEREFERVGDSTSVKVNVRVVAATNRDLKEKVRQGHFRSDLYYRLKVIEINLPPLREKSEDIPLLTDHFLEHFKSKMNKNIHTISNDVISRFMQYPWPGNVRELEHALEHAFILCQGSTITTEHLPLEIMYHDTGENIPANNGNDDDEREEIISTLNRTGWNKSKTARLLGISRRTMHRKIDKYKLSEHA